MHATCQNIHPMSRAAKGKIGFMLSLHILFFNVLLEAKKTIVLVACVY
jgi:hypothetical protein